MKTRTLFLVVLLILPLQGSARPAASVAANQTSNASASVPSERAAEPNGATVEISEKDLYELQKVKIQQDLKDDLAKWAKDQAWIFALIIAAAGYVGIRSLVRELINEELKTARQVSIDAQASGALARESAKEVRAELVRHKELVEGAAGAAEKVNSDLLELRSRIEGEGQRSIAASELLVSGLEQQLAEFKNTLAALSADSERHRELAAEAEVRLQRVRDTAEVEKANFEHNGTFHVTLVPYDRGTTSAEADAITSALAEQGYRVSRSVWGYPTPVTAKGSLKVEFTPGLEGQANAIVERMVPLLGGPARRSDIRLVPNPRPLQNSKPQVVVFWD